MNIVVSILTWVIGKLFELALFAVWLALYLLGVLFKASVWAVRGGKSDAPILVWNHPRAVAELLAPDEEGTLSYCGRGGWEHKMYRYYLSQIAYVYLTSRRILIVSKNRGNHEFDLANIQLETDGSTGTLHLRSPAHAVYLGFVPDEGIRAIVAAVNNGRDRGAIGEHSETVG
ncbi:MAG: hypothetical protein ACRDR6_30975 [Pseudonocardiaceae bacterium]